jgi:hypothetical protein
MDTIQIVAIAASFTLIVIIIDLIRRGRLKEKYSLLWIFSGLVIFLFAAWRELLHIVSKWVGVYYPPSFLFLLLTAFLVLIILHFSVVISKLSEQNKILGQEIALLWNELRKRKEV